MTEKKTNVERLHMTKYIGDLRMSLGAQSPVDTSRDERINSLGVDELMRAYVGWTLGHFSWWDSFMKLKGLLESE